MTTFLQRSVPLVFRGSKMLVMISSANVRISGVCASSLAMLRKNDSASFFTWWGSQLNKLWMFSCQPKHQIVESPNKCKCCAGTPQNPLIVNLECKPANPRIQIASLRASPTASRKADMIFLGQLQRFAEIFVWNDLLVTCKWFNCNSCFCTMFLTQQLHVGIWGSWYGMATEDIFWHYRSPHGLITLGSLNRGGNGISQREIPINVGAEAPQFRTCSTPTWLTQNPP